MMLRCHNEGGIQNLRRKTALYSTTRRSLGGAFAEVMPPFNIGELQS
jgi:hypothetical protein